VLVGSVCLLEMLEEILRQVLLLQLPLEAEAVVEVHLLVQVLSQLLLILLPLQALVLLEQATIL
jgi:hypothetical protein